MRRRAASSTSIRASIAMPDRSGSRTGSVSCSLDGQVGRPADRHGGVLAVLDPRRGPPPFRALETAEERLTWKVVVPEGEVVVVVAVVAVAVVEPDEAAEDVEVRLAVPCRAHRDCTAPHSTVGTR